MPKPAESSSSIHSTMLHAVRRRDPEAWRQLVHLFSPLIYDWCRQQGVQAADAADVTQDVFRSVMKGLDAFQRDGPEDSFRGWLWTITRNKIRDLHRARAARPGAYGGTDAWQMIEQLPDEAPPSQSGSSTSQVSVSPLHRALEVVRNDFGDNTWQAFWRVTIEDQQAAEVAAELGISVNAVRKAKARVLRRLREEFGDLLE